MTKEKLIGALVDSKIAVNEVAGTLNLSFGLGLHAQKVNVDLEEALSHITNRVDLFHFVSGVCDVMKESKRSLARKLNFAKSAATMLPQVYRTSYVAGTALAGDEALHEVLGDDLIRTFTVRADTGIHVISKAQFEHWGVNISRLHAAARSMLFHHTDGIAITETESHFVAKKGDGHDTARYVVAQDHPDFPDMRFVAFPTTGSLWFSDTDSFADQVKQAFMNSDKPLCDHLFRLNDQELVRHD